MIHSIDLTVANRIHIVEPNWNPMVEAQAIDRVHRMGQTRDIFVTKYIVKNSIETVNTTCCSCKKSQSLIIWQYIQWVQEDKLNLIKQSIDLVDASQSDVENARLEVGIHRILYALCES